LPCPDQYQYQYQYTFVHRAKHVYLSLLRVLLDNDPGAGAGAGAGAEAEASTREEGVNTGFDSNRNAVLTAIAAAERHFDKLDASAFLSLLPADTPLEHLSRVHALVFEGLDADIRQLEMTHAMLRVNEVSWLLLLLLLFDLFESLLFCSPFHERVFFVAFLNISLPISLSLSLSHIPLLRARVRIFLYRSRCGQSYIPSTDRARVHS
jgi:hypothetical protein